MSNRVIRWEKGKNRKGEDEVFIHIEVTDGSEIYHSAEWLSPSDVFLVLTDESNINIIADQVEARAIIKRPSLLEQLEKIRLQKIEEENAVKL